MVWMLSHYVLSAGLIGTGVAIKSIHPYSAKPVPVVYVRLMVASLGFSLPIVGLQQILHPGIMAFMRAPRARTRRLSLFFFKLFASFCTLLMLAFPPETYGYVFMLYSSALAMVCAYTTFLEKTTTCEVALWEYAESMEKVRPPDPAPPLPVAKRGSLADDDSVTDVSSSSRSNSIDSTLTDSAGLVA